MTEISPEERQDLLQTLLWVMRQWDIEPGIQPRLLGLPEGTPARALQQYSQGKTLPDETLFLRHAEKMLAIYRAIASFFPGNPTMANYWVTTPSQSLGGRSPLDIMLKDGLDGMQYCLDHLNGDLW